MSLDNDASGKTRTVDKTVGEQLGAYEERLDFFERKETKVDKEAVDVSNKLYVDGLESIISAFGINPVAVDPDDEMVQWDGIEGFSSTIRNVLATIIQMAKDAAAFLMNLINNKLVRLDNTLFRLKGRRKRNGIVDKEVAYPLGVRRLMVPNGVTEGPEWIPTSFNEIKKIYQDAISGYNKLLELVDVAPSKFDLSSAMVSLNTAITVPLGMSAGKRNDDGTTSYRRGPIPGNRYFQFDSYVDPESTRPSIHFADTTMEVKLKSKTWTPTSFILDKVIDSIQGIIDEVRKNQKTVGELHRTFEKAVLAFERKEGGNVTPEQRKFLRYLIATNKRLVQMTVQYVTSACDIGIDFCNAGINK